jgi:GH35 family endo-1,4-beta-xylanase
MRPAFMAVLMLSCLAGMALPIGATAGTDPQKAFAKDLAAVQGCVSRMAGDLYGTLGAIAEKYPGSMSLVRMTPTNAVVNVDVVVDCFCRKGEKFSTFAYCPGSNSALVVLMPDHKSPFTVEFDPDGTIAGVTGVLSSRIGRLDAAAMKCSVIDVGGDITPGVPLFGDDSRRGGGYEAYAQAVLLEQDAFDLYWGMRALDLSVTYDIPFDRAIANSMRWNKLPKRPAFSPDPASQPAEKTKTPELALVANVGLDEESPAELNLEESSGPVRIPLLKHPQLEEARAAMPDIAKNVARMAKEVADLREAGPPTDKSSVLDKYASEPFLPAELVGSEKAEDKDAIDALFMKHANASIERNRKGDVSIVVAEKDGTPIPGSRIEVFQTRHAFLFSNHPRDLTWPGHYAPAYKHDVLKRLYSDLFNAAVLPFYWGVYEPERGKTRHEDAWRVIKWCRENRIALKGHPLAWRLGSAIPRWTRDLPADESARIQMERITRDVTAFRGHIDTWDVVNEPVHVGAWPGTTSENSWILRMAEYIEKCYRTAHAANPDAHLILNDYMLMSNKRDRYRFYDLAKVLRIRGAPVTDLGLQGHEPAGHWFSPESVWATLDLLAGLGCRLHISELCPQTSGRGLGGWRAGEGRVWDEEAQADFAVQMYTLGFAYPKVESIVWWGLSDHDIWARNGGLIDAEYRPKLVYRRLKKLIHKTWKTDLELTTDPEGKASFRGFFGEYSVRIQHPDNRIRTVSMTIERGKRNEWILRE